MSALTSAEILFEGFYEVSHGKRHIGYAIQRLEFDSSSKQYTHTSYSFLSAYFGKSNLSTCEVSVANKDWSVISYKKDFTSDNQALHTLANFKEGVMTVVGTGGEKKINTTKSYTPGVPLATFNNYFLKDKIDAKNVSFHYIKTTNLEEEKAEAQVTKFEKPYRGSALLYSKLITSGSGEITSYITADGDNVMFDVKNVDLQYKLVDTLALAKGSFKYDPALIKNIFGGIPSGAKNPFHK